MENEKHSETFLETINKFNFSSDTQKDQLYAGGIADAYEKVFKKDIGWHAPQRVAEIIARLTTDKTARILDLGCGTGFVAEELRQKGYTNIFGIDASAEMLEISRRKNVYVGIEKVVVGDETTIPEEYRGKYDIVSSVGFIGGPTHGLEDTYASHLICAKVGGYIIFTTSPLYMPETFRKKRLDIASEGRWEILDEFTIKKYDTLLNTHGAVGGYQRVAEDTITVCRRLK